MDIRNFAGAKGIRKREENDFYATDPEEVSLFLDNFQRLHLFDVKTILEPCAGQGHIANVLKRTFTQSVVDTNDIVDRGYELTSMIDLSMHTLNKKYDFIITNPPFNCAENIIKIVFKCLIKAGLPPSYLNLTFLKDREEKHFLSFFRHDTFLFALTVSVFRVMEVSLMLMEKFFQMLWRLCGLYFRAGTREKRSLSGYEKVVRP